MTQFSICAVALDALRDDCGRFPTTEEGLAALCIRPAAIGETKWRGPYLSPPIPLDPWGHAYVYRCPGVHNTNGFDIYSCGPDGVSKSGGEDADDITNWPKPAASH
jgi:general secretion pathway protein G